MAADPNASTGEGTVTLESKSVPIDLGSGREGAVFVPGDIVNRFNVGSGTTAAISGMVLRKRKGGTIQLYENAVDITGESKTVEAAEWYEPPRLKGGGGGRAVSFQTGHTTPKGTKRMATLRFPGGATNAVISNWLYKNLIAHKPVWFKTESGSRYAIIDGSGIPDLNPGNHKPATAPATT